MKQTLWPLPFVTANNSAWHKLHKATFLMVVTLTLVICSGCLTPGPHTMGAAGEELLYMVPGDTVQLEDGRMAYVNAHGDLVGIEDITIRAAGRKMRDVMNQLSREVYFDRYRLVSEGPRTIEIYGSVGFPGKYEFPPHEGWNIMNLLTKVEALTTEGQREYLVVRRAWQLPGKYVFIRGLSIPTLAGMGGDDLPLFAYDQIIFPGSRVPIYVFGAVKAPVCFSFEEQKTPPTLQQAINKTGGLLNSADKHNIEVYRVLRGNQRSVYKLNLQEDPSFELEPWDVIHVSALIPKRALESSVSK